MVNLDNNETFERVFRDHFKELCRIIYPILHDRQTCEDVVHDVFIKLWEKRESINVEKTLKGYLYKSVVYAALDQVKKQKRQKVVDKEDLEGTLGGEEESSATDVKEMRRIIREGINTLPEKCRAVFTLSRFNKMKNREIAEYLDISIKTVENQMTKALKVMREHLRKNAIDLCWLAFFCHFFNL